MDDLDLAKLTEPTEFLDFEHEAVAAFTERAVAGADSPTERAVRLFYQVRDHIDYEVYRQDLSPAGIRASATVDRGEGFCVHKSILYAAAVRAVGIPSRLVVGEVRNHLASPQLKDLVGGEVFVHWLTSIYLDGRWLKVTPVFNKLLCRLYGIATLDFDGTADAVDHPFSGSERMEFLADHGEFDDVAYDTLIGLMRRRHPRMFTPDTKVPGTGTETLAGQAPGRG
jgi:transglutaminase-like putative cysteine protease